MIVDKHDLDRPCRCGRPIRDAEFVDSHTHREHDDDRWLWYETEDRVRCECGEFHFVMSYH